LIHNIIVTVIFIPVVNYDIITTGKASCSLVYLLYSLLFIGIGYGIYFISLALKIYKQPRDEFYLKYELAISSILGIFVVIFSAFAIPFLQNEVDIVIDIGLSLILALYCIVTVFPAILTFLPKINIYDHEPVRSIKDVLEQPDLLLIFTDHLVKEFAVDNILFYYRVEALKKLNINENISHKLMNELVDTFIVTNAPMQLNFDNNFQQKILNATSNASCFEEILNAEILILQQLHDDTFLRFLRTPEFKKHSATKTVIKSTIIDNLKV